MSAAVHAVPPDWLPTRGAELVPCGRWWDAVQLPTFTAVRLIGQLADASGPVVQDQQRDTVTWLLPAGTPRTDYGPEVTVLDLGHAIRIPPAAWRGGPYDGAPAVRWLIPPAGDCLTDPAVLYGALDVVLAGVRRG